MQNKVLILANSSSGLWGFRKELIQSLKEKYKEVVASTPNSGSWENFESIGCRVIDTQIDRRGINPIKDLKLVLFYINLIKKEKPDRVITYTIKPNIYGGFSSRLLRVPYVVNITGLGTTFQNEGILKKIVTFLYKCALKKAAVVFFENQENLQIFVDEGIVKEEQTCLLNGAGVNLEYYYPCDYPEDDEVIRFLFTGRVMKEKGVDELFEAMQRLRSDGILCTLDILGYYEEDYEARIQQYQDEGWLSFHGYQADVRPFVQNSHCFVLPSWHEGMANTNLECAAMGRPVITSNIYGCKEAAIDGVSGYLCEKKNADSLYYMMKKFILLSHQEKIDMGKYGRKHMEAVFDKKNVVKETIKKI